MKKLAQKIGVALLALCLPAAAAPKKLVEAPAWSLKTPQGQTVNFPADAQGRPTVLMFWPSWCPFSRALQPYVQDIWNDYKAAGVNVWTLNIKEDRDPVEVLRERGLSFPLLIQADAVADAYGLQYTPWLVVIDGRNNHIVYTRPPKPPSPVHTAKEVRELLNKMLGDKAVPLPKSYAKPYDLHLKDPATLNQRLEPVAIPAKQAGDWADQYLAGVAANETVADRKPVGPVADGKTAIQATRELWNAAYGEEATRAQAPYRAYRRNTRWIVLGDGLNTTLGQGFIAVLDADTGRVIRLSRGGAKP